MDSDDEEDVAGDLLVGAEAIAAHLRKIGWGEDTDEDDVYYLKRARILPIGSTAEGRGGKLISTKSGINRKAKKFATPAT